MRDFKFRAWDRENKKMYYNGFCLIPTKPGWGATEYHDENKSLGFDRSSFDWASGGLLTGNLVIMQSTGLEDKNNKEIFEGDILSFEKTLSKFKKGNSDIMTVEYNRDYARFILTFTSIYGGEGYTGEVEHMHGYVKEGAAVIGHRYQTKFSKYV